MASRSLLFAVACFLVIIHSALGAGLSDKEFEVAFTVTDSSLKCSACQLSARLFRRAIGNLVDEQRDEAKRFLASVASMDDISTADPRYGWFQSIKHYAPSEQMELLWRNDFQRIGSPAAFLTLEEICTHEQEHVGVVAHGNKLLPALRHLEGANEGEHSNGDYFPQRGEHRHETFLQDEKSQRQMNEGASGNEGSSRIVQRRWASSAFARECYDLYHRTQPDLMDYALSKKDVSWCSAVCVDKKKRLGDDDL